jgi:tripartite-type tricarboxylate transporter receptor subunit TctC
MVSKCWLAGFAAISILAAPVHAQTGGAFPSKPVRLVVPFAPGGPADMIGRLVGTELSASLGQQVIVENKPGAGGAIGAEFVARAEPDGHTLLMSNVGDTIAVSLYKSMPYDYVRAFTPVSLVASTPFIVVVHPSVPATSIADLVRLAKAKPGGLTFGSAGVGVASHLAGELFNQMAGTSITHVPYKGQAPATTDLLGGQITMMFNNPLTALPHVNSGKLRALGVTSAKRLSVAPGIPTVAESGVPGFDVGTWFAIVAPAGTPAAAVNRISAEIARGLAVRETREKLAAQGVEVVGSTPAELGRLIQADVAKWADVIKRGGIRQE